MYDVAEKRIANIINFPAAVGNIFEGYIAIASIASFNNTFVIDCTKDEDQDLVTVASVIKEMAESTDVLKIMCGCQNDVFRMRRDFECYPFLLVDVQDLFVEWKRSDIDDCFNVCYNVIKSIAVEKKRSTSTDALFQWFQEYNTPSLDFLMQALGIPDRKDKTLTMTDWTKPLSERQLNYAAKDTFYLLEIFYRLYGVVRKIRFEKFLPAGRKLNVEVISVSSL